MFLRMCLFLCANMYYSAPLLKFVCTKTCIKELSHINKDAREHE